jgi:hypothetical protein
MDFSFLPQTMDSQHSRKPSIVDSAYGSYEDELPYNGDWKFDLRRDSIEQFLYPVEFAVPMDSDFYIPELEPLSCSPMDIESVMYPQFVLPQEPIQEQVQPTSPKQTDKKFPCSMCPSSFSRNHDLKRHMRIHLGIRPYKCHYCPKAFTRMDALHRHTTVGGCKSQK